MRFRRYYDAMLAKMIAWAPTRDEAIERLNRGLEETDVRGIVTNIPFLSALVTHPDVRANAIDTGFIERELTSADAACAAAAAISSLARRVAAILGEEAKAARRRTRIRPGRPPAGCRSAAAQRLFTFRHGQGAEQKVNAALRQRSGDAVDRRTRDSLRDPHPSRRRL